MSENFVNMKLAEERGVLDKVSEMNELYKELQKLLQYSPEFSNTEKVIERVEEIEFELQDLWEFGKDRNYHKYWYRLNGCTCPKMDNEDRFGTDLRSHAPDCPWHGKTLEYSYDIKIFIGYEGKRFDTISECLEFIEEKRDELFLDDYEILEFYDNLDISINGKSAKVRVDITPIDLKEC